MDDDNRRGADADDSELHFEVSSLVPAQPPGPQRPRRQLRPRTVRTLAVGGAVVLALAVLLGSLAPVRSTLFGQLPAPSAPRAVASSPPTAALGDVPTGCPPGNSVDTFSPVYGPGVGIADLNVWFVGFSGPSATLHLAGAMQTPLGWPAKLIVAAARDVTQPLALSVEAMGEGTVRLSLDGPGEAAATLTLDPATAPASADGWRSWPLQLYVPSAGCYYMRVQYGGHETPGTFFAAGR